MASITRRATLEMLAAACVATPTLAQSPSRPTAREVFAEIKKASAQPWNPNPTDDRIIFGDLATPVTGIATCFFPTLDILGRARAAGLNYIVPHEASFFERYDDFAESAIRDDDPTLSAKVKFVRENQMVIQRMHAHAHSMGGDFIMTGLLRQLGWSQYRIEGQSPICRIPRASAMEIGRHIKRSCGRRTMRMFGDPERPVSTISITAGMPGENVQIAQLETAGVDAVLMGEVREAEVIGYAQDLAATRPVVVYLSGHTGEDFGMADVAGWLRGVFPSLPVQWLPLTDPYTDPA